ncbi:MAG: amino acid ABC transporter permease [Acetobacteraceae bacterium]
MAVGPGFGWIEVYAGLLSGVATTIELIVVATVFSSVLSVLGAAGRRSNRVWCRGAVGGYVELIRNTPFIAQLFFIYFGLPSLGPHLSAIAAAIVAMTINLSAYGIEIVRAGLDAVAPGQREAGRALGLRATTIFLRIVLPEAMRAVFPALASQIVITMLESSVVSVIAVGDLTYHADLIQSRTFQAFRTYLVATLIYLVLSILLRRVLGIGARRLFGAGIG